MQSYQPNHPRPQFARDLVSWEDLNGTWDFACDDDDAGLAEQWYRRFPADPRSITVPFAPETPASGVGDPEPHEIVWYHRQFFVDGSRLKDRRIFLYLEGCDYAADVWVNGVHAGSHQGAYARAAVEITGAIKPGSNAVVVRANDPFDPAQCRGKQRWMPDSYGCWYVQTTGIWKTVWIEFIPVEYLRGVRMTPRLADGRLDMEAEIDARFDDQGSGFDGGLELEAEITFDEEPVTRVTVPVTGPRVRLWADVRSTSLTEWGVFAWAPGAPNLYDVTFRLRRDGHLLDKVYSYFGMRDIRVDGSQVLLNGAPLYQRLILDQGYWPATHLTPPNEAALITDIDRVMAAGYNGVRKHQKIEDERFLYWADVKGLLVWSEMAAAYEFNDHAAAAFTREWLEIVAQNYNHPSIITWTPFNESWGVPNIVRDPAQQRFTEAIYNLTKAIDPTRPVICNDGWEHTISDIVTIHDYEESPEAFLKRYERLDEVLAGRPRGGGHRAMFAHGYGYRGQPVIVSEFGGIASTSGEGWGYGSRVGSPEEYLRRFSGITGAIKALPGVVGYCYTQVTDVQQEINGIMDADRAFKVNPDRLREINLQ